MILSRNKGLVFRCNNIIKNKQNYERLLCSSHSKIDKNDPPNYAEKVKSVHPAKRTYNILKNDVNNMKKYVASKFQFLGQSQDSESKSGSTSAATEHIIKHRQSITKQQETDFQTHCDVVIIGGGGMGSSIAYWLKKRAREGLNVVVVEKDSMYKTASTPLSVGGLRQQFSLEENIQMSLYGADFIRNSKENLGDVDLNFTPFGYLMLATDQTAEILQRNSKLQNELGARNEILTAKRLKEKFPWLNTDGIELGCHGLEKEGWFDPWALLCGFKRKAQEFGAHYINGEVVGFDFKSQPDVVVEGVDAGTYTGLDKLLLKMPNDEIRTIKFAICINAAGPQSGEVARMANIGTGSGMLSVKLPVEPRKRYVYVFSCENDSSPLCPGLNTPLTIDPSNVYFRREGLSGLFIGGRSPESIEKEPSIDNLDVDYEYFDTDVWPHLAHRIPSFEAIKVKSAWAGYYEFNTFDENGIIGPHPYYNNLYIATGFSGHGIQQTPAVGRAISELIIDGDFRTIDLTRLGFDRIIVEQPMYEVNIV